MYKQIVKPILDIVLALFIFIVSSPVLLVVTIVLFIDNSGKPFFIQTRAGKNGKPFKIIKFRTMNDKTDKEGNLLPAGERITKIGRLIRKISLDEFPQLINVLKGDISMIGPRPLIMDYLPLYNKQQARRHEVKPGITGLAQINGRNSLTWEEKFRYDVRYVDRISFTLDTWILLLTIKKVILREGIMASSLVPMERFTGNS